PPGAGEGGAREAEAAGGGPLGGGEAAPPPARARLAHAPGEAAQRVPDRAANRGLVLDDEDRAGPHRGLRGGGGGCGLRLQQSALDHAQRYRETPTLGEKSRSATVFVRS